MLYNLDAVKGLHLLDCSVFILDFSISPPSKLGMHKMELGDSVYAAERIMKKRIRKVSFIFIFLPSTILKLAKAVVITNLPLYFLDALLQLTAWLLAKSAWFVEIWLLLGS